tara:strand:+ start:947 stop:1312 length:366 start_codon:yes stop_codon:yes gene_type:complete
MSQIEMVQVRGELAVIAELEARGYTIVSRSRTLLGRVRLEAEAATHLREIVLHQSTGEILSDAVIRVFADTSGATNAGTAGPAGTGSIGGDASLGVDVDVDPAGDGIGADIGVDGGLGIGN